VGKSGHVTRTWHWDCRLVRAGDCRAQFETGAAGTMYFQPGGVFFWNTPSLDFDIENLESSRCHVSLSLGRSEISKSPIGTRPQVWDLYRAGNPLLEAVPFRAVIASQATCQTLTNKNPRRIRATRPRFSSGPGAPWRDLPSLTLVALDGGFGRGARGLTHMDEAAARSRLN
jgi:hypothetical protein